MSDHLSNSHSQILIKQLSTNKSSIKQHLSSIKLEVDNLEKRLSKLSLMNKKDYGGESSEEENENISSNDGDKTKEEIEYSNNLFTTCGTEIQIISDDEEPQSSMLTDDEASCESGKGDDGGHAGDDEKVFPGDEGSMHDDEISDGRDYDGEEHNNVVASLDEDFQNDKNCFDDESSSSSSSSSTRFSLIDEMEELFEEIEEC